MGSELFTREYYARRRSAHAAAAEEGLEAADKATENIVWGANKAAIATAHATLAIYYDGLLRDG